MDRQQLTEIVNNKDLRRIINSFDYTRKRIYKHNQMLYDELQEKFPGLILSFNEVKYWHKYINDEDFIDVQLCRKCGKRTEFSHGYYTHYCSIECRKMSYNKERFDKIKQTCLERYGAVNPMCKGTIVRNKLEQTFMERFGGLTPMRSKEVREKVSKTHSEHYHSSDNIKNKRAKTNLERYGVENYFASKEMKEFLHSIKDERLEKVYATKRKNKTFNTSKPEKRCYAATLSKFSDAKTQYKEDRYPFLCDIYIPSKDLFIELQFSWTHGSKPYDENDKDCIDLVESWIRNGSDFCREAALNYTQRDTKKRQTAKENKLNYLEFFYEEDFMSWLDSQS